MRHSSQIMSVTSADFVRRFGRWQDHVASNPVIVTHHGRDRLVALSMESYRALSEEGASDVTSADDDARLATVLERMSEGFIAFDGAMRFEQANPVACAYLRTTRDALIGTALSEEHADFGRSLAHSRLLRAAQSGEVAAFDAPSLVYPDNWLHFRTFPYGAGAACLFRNITEEMETRRRADTKAAIIAAMAAHGLIGHARLTPRATLASVDASFAAMSGFAAESLALVRLTDILPLDRRVAAAEEIEAVLSGGGARAFDSALLVNRGGELPVRMALAELKGEYVSDGAVLVVTPR